MRRVALVVTLLGTLSGVISTNAQAAGSYDERSTAGRVLLNGVAVLANVVPVLPALWAKPCLPGYVLCKATYAFASVLFAGEQVLFSGANDMPQASTIIRRGFGGDWFLTGRHINGDTKPVTWGDSAGVSEAARP